MSVVLMSQIKPGYPFADSCDHPKEHVCDHDCHEYEALGIEIDHYLPCCEQCGKCRNRIKVGYVEAHKQKCHKEQKKSR